MRKPSLMKRPEQDLQRAIASYLEGRKCFARDLAYTHIPNGGRRGRVEAAIFKGMGVVAGAPDFVIWRRGGAVLNIELKAKGGSLSAAQRAFGENLKALGHCYHIVVAETPGQAVDQVARLLDATAGPGA